jgi:nitroimidazol reductase NimA-like FMN-containing flavoprotein (pyridoxamine 5'-phosphate oxidase superfamily)
MQRDEAGNPTTGEEREPAEVLDARACWALLASAKVGRLALVVGGAPEIFPVNHVVDHGSVVFRTAAGTKLAGIRSATRVAFEADGLDLDARVAWSVVVKGRAIRVAGRNQVLEAAALSIHPWHDTPKNWFVRIQPDAVTGRRFTVAEPPPDETPDGEEHPR